MKQALLCFQFFLCALPVFAQIHGKVQDERTSKPLIDAHIVADDELTITDNQGNFTLQKPTTLIIATYIGYIPDTLIIFDYTQKVIINLQPLSGEIEQIIIEGNLNEFPVMLMPSAVGYIDDLERQNVNTISWIENLNTVPGIFVHSGALNTNRATIRGIGSRTPYGTNRIKAYYNEIPLTTGDGSTEIEDINASNIGSIEILKGSKSALYGSGLGGVIVLNKPQYSNGIHGFARSGAASFQTFQYEAELQFKQKGFFIGGNYSNSRSDGWRENSNYYRDNFSFNAGFTNARNQIDITLLAIKTNAEIPSSLNKQVFEDSPENAAQNWLDVKGYEAYSKLISGIKFKHLFNEHLSNSTNVFIHLYNGYESRPFNILDDDMFAWGLRNITTFQLLSLKIQLGFETLFEDYSWSIYNTLSGIKGELENKFSERRTPLTIFLNGQYQFKNKTVIEAGLSLNTLHYQLSDEFSGINNLSQEYRYNWVLSPFIGFNFPAGKDFNVYGSVSHGFSAPSVEETLLPEGSINPDLKPETGLNAETGFRYNSKSERFFMDACIYGLWVRNLLVTKRETEEIFYGINAGKTSHYGFELSSTIRINHPESEFPVTMNVNYNQISAIFTDFVDDGIDYSGNTLPGIPRQNLLFSFPVESSFGMYLFPQFQYTGKQYLNDANKGSYEPYCILNFKLGYCKKFGKVKTEVEFAIGNLMDQHYASMILVNAPSFGESLPRYYYPGTPRNYSVSINIGF